MNNITPIAKDRLPAMGLVPASMSEAMRFAEMMANTKLVPKQFQGKAADCLMVIQQAIRWDMDPFAVVQECSVIQDKLMYSGKLVAAVVNTRGRLLDRLAYSYQGKGDDLAIVVTGRLQGEIAAREVSVRYSNARTTAAVWKSQPEQQLMYHGARVWARRHMPELMLGVYSPEEFEPNGIVDAETGEILEKRPNPHVVRPDDVVDVPAPDHPDRIPNGASDVKPMPKKNAREDNSKIQKEMYAIRDVNELKEWAKKSADRIATQPLDWQDILRGQYVAHLTALRNQPPAEPQIDEEPSWLGELDFAYGKCQTIDELFEVDRQMYHPIVATVSPADQASADLIRQEHLDRIADSDELPIT